MFGPRFDFPEEEEQGEINLSALQLGAEAFGQRFLPVHEADQDPPTARAPGYFTHYSLSGQGTARPGLRFRDLEQGLQKEPGIA